jgi:RsiW-degrading membrane proteinase PrsW (M82 family)
MDETRFTEDLSRLPMPEPKPFPSRIGAYLLAILKSRLYWGILLFAIVPILLETFGVNVVFGMLVYFSLFWFFVFRPMVKTSEPGRSLAADIVAYVFTAVIGTLFAFYVESFWVANGAGPLLQSRSPSIAIPSFIVFVGITEEFAKQIIVLLGVAFVRVRGMRVRPVEFMIMGISSGLGFSALENISYVQKGIMNEVVHHMVGAGVVTALSRALYTPFLHTIFAGVAAYGLGLAAQRGGKAWWAALGLWLFSSCCHGFYDATIGTHVVWALVDVALCYFLFLALLLEGMRGRRTVQTG